MRPGDTVGDRFLLLQLAGVCRSRWCVVLVALAACSQAKSEPSKVAPAPFPAAAVVATDAPPVVVDATASDTTAPDATASDATAPDAGGFATTITKDGIGPFDAKLENSVDAIGELVPGLTVTSTKNQSESHDIDQITVSRRGKAVLTMVMDNYRGGDKLFTLSAVDPMFATATGIRVGSTVKELFARHAELACKFQKYDPNLDVLGVAKRMFCEAKDLPNVAFELDASAWKGREGKIAVDKIADRKLVAIGWRAPR